MKKLLTLLLVVGLVGVANASTVTVWVESGGGTYTVKACVGWTV